MKGKVIITYFLVFLSFEVVECNKIEAAFDGISRYLKSEHVPCYTFTGHNLGKHLGKSINKQEGSAFSSSLGLPSLTLAHCELNIT